MKNIDETIKQQESLAAYFDRRVDRAKDLASAIPRGALYIALEGVDTEEDLVLVERVARIRKVCQPPGLVEITLAADLKHTDYLGVARHTEKVTAEVVMAETEWKLTTTLDVAWTIVVMLKLRRHENILASFCSAVSIDIVPTIADQSIQFNILDDYVARLTVPATPTHVDRDDAEWIENSLMSVLKLRADLDSKRFSLAFSIYHEWSQRQHRRNPREFERGRQALGDQVHHRPSQPVADAEMPLQRVQHEPPILHQERLVQPQLMHQRNLLGLRVGGA